MVATRGWGVCWRRVRARARERPREAGQTMLKGILKGSLAETWCGGRNVNIGEVVGNPVAYGKT